MAEDYHADNPLADGIPRQELLSRLKEIWFTEDDKLVQAFVKHMLSLGVIEDRGKSIAISGFSIEYTEEQKALKDKIAGMYENAGIEILPHEQEFLLIAPYGQRTGIVKGLSFVSDITYDKLVPLLAERECAAEIRQPERRVRIGVDYIFKLTEHSRHLSRCAHFAAGYSLHKRR